MKILKVMIAATMLLAGTSVNAELIKTDWQTEGDNGAVLDTNSGITWLQLNHSTTSIQTIINRMVKGGSLEGWSFATREQVDSLWANGKSYVYDRMNKVSGGRYVAARGYNDDTDSSYFVGVRERTVWYDKAGYLTANQYGWYVVKGEGAALSEVSKLYSLPENYVSASSVPLTSSALLMLAGFIALRRKIK